MQDIKAKLQQLVDRGYNEETVFIYGERYKMKSIAEEHGITLPHAKKAKKQVNTIEDIKEEEHADMGQTFDQGDTE
jgi:hypothetical protein